MFLGVTLDKKSKFKKNMLKTPVKRCIKRFMHLLASLLIKIRSNYFF